jgi:uncharacterized membrane protein
VAVVHRLFPSPVSRSPTLGGEERSIRPVERANEQFGRKKMSDDKTYLAYVGAYSSVEDAEADFEGLKEIKSEGEIRDLTAAIVSKDENGRIHTHQTTHAGKVAGGVGVVGGAILGAIFPPAGMAVLGAAVVEAAVGGVVLGSIGHLAGGASRKDLRELGSYLDEGEAAILAVAVDAVSTDVDAALDRSVRKASKAIDKGDVEKAVAELEKGLDKADEIAGA